MGISGTCNDGFGGVREAFEANFTPVDGIFDEGASVAVTVDGEMVVDLWGGTANRDAGESLPWEEDTIINVWSTTKTVAALAMLMLADRGELDLYAPVATYWPEFAVEGKENVAVRHIMSHTAGLSGWAERIDYSDLYDRRKVAALLGAQAPWWEPGTASGYHAITQGYLEGEIVQRVTGQSLGQFVAENITGPLGADFHIGTTAEHDSRVAHVVPPPPMALPDGIAPDSVLMKTFGNPVLDATKSWDIDWRRAEIPAAGGHGNARSVAQIHTPMVCGGEANGVRLLGKETIDAVFDEQIDGTDLVLQVPFRHGIGFGLQNAALPMSPNDRVCFWGGWGGSLAILDLDARMSFSYVMNKMGEGTVGDLRGANLLIATYAALAQR